MASQEFMDFLLSAENHALNVEIPQQLEATLDANNHPVDGSPNVNLPGQNGSAHPVGGNPFTGQNPFGNTYGYQAGNPFGNPSVARPVVSSTTVVTPQMLPQFPALLPPVNHAVRLEKNSGADFKTWQNKMLFYLTTLGLARYLSEEEPVVGPDDTDFHRRAAWDAWKHADFLCRNYILDGLQDSLYQVYVVTKSAKDL